MHYIRAIIKTKVPLIPSPTQGQPLYEMHVAARPLGAPCHRIFLLDHFLGHGSHFSLSLVVVVFNGRSLYFQEHLREIGMLFVIITMRDSVFLGDEF